MKLIIQIPCYNEAETLPVALAELPRSVEGVGSLEWLVIDDGSVDDTARVAVEHGVDHVVRHTGNQGLARAYMTGLEACLDLGADIIVNTDADNQYNADDIPALIKPILEGKADMVIGARPISEISHFSPLKKMLQEFGSWVVRVVSGTSVPDAPSGFRAMKRSAAMRLNVFSEYTYTLETIIQAGQKNMVIASVPVRVNKDLRPSRLLRSIPSYVIRSMMTILRVFVIYKPFGFFACWGAIMFGSGLILGLRFLLYYLIGQGDGMVQSLLLASVLMLSGFFAFLVAFLADQLAANRKMLEDIKLQLRRDKFQKQSESNG